MHPLFLRERQTEKDSESQRERETVEVRRYVCSAEAAAGVSPPATETMRNPPTLSLI